MRVGRRTTINGHKKKAVEQTKGVKLALPRFKYD